MLLATTLLLLAWRAQPDRLLHVIFLETKGDAALIQTPGGGYVLIDGGADPAALTAALGRRMPFWQRRTRAGGADLARRQAPARPGCGAGALPGCGGAGPAARVGRGATLNEWRRLLDAQRARVRTARVGDRLDLGGATLRVLAIGDGDEDGMMLRLDYGATSVVLGMPAARSTKRRWPLLARCAPRCWPSPGSATRTPPSSRRCARARWSSPTGRRPTRPALLTDDRARGWRRGRLPRGAQRRDRVGQRWAAVVGGD